MRSSKLAHPKPLGPLDAAVSDSAGHIARASDTRVVYSAPLFSYVLTATPDPVAPGHVLEFDATVTNLTAGSQSVVLNFTVPEYTTYGALGAGNAASYNFGYIPAGHRRRRSYGSPWLAAVTFHRMGQQLRSMRSISRAGRRFRGARWCEQRRL